MGAQLSLISYKTLKNLRRFSGVGDDAMTGVPATIGGRSSRG